VAKKPTKKKIVRREYTASDVKLLKTHSRARTPISKLTVDEAIGRLIETEGIDARNWSWPSTIGLNRKRPKKGPCSGPRLLFEVGS